jgi:hypothetical protein
MLPSISSEIVSRLGDDDTASKEISLLTQLDLSLCCGGFQQEYDSYFDAIKSALVLFSAFSLSIHRRHASVEKQLPSSSIHIVVEAIKCGTRCWNVSGYFVRV